LLLLESSGSLFLYFSISLPQVETLTTVLYYDTVYLERNYYYFFKVKPWPSLDESNNGNNVSGKERSFGKYGKPLASWCLAIGARESQQALDKLSIADPFRVQSGHSIGRQRGGNG